MKTHLYPLFALALLLGTPAPAAATPREAYNIDDYRVGEFEVRYITLRGYGCQVLWECDGMLDCTNGATGARVEDGKPYFSPLILAMLDLRQCTKFTPGKLETPHIQGNTPEKARELVLKLIDENRDNCVNDLMDWRITPLFLAIGDLELTRLLLRKGANPNKIISHQGDTLLSRAVEHGEVKMVELLLSHGATPQLRVKHQGGNNYDDPLSEQAIHSTSDPDKLKCIALVLKAQVDNPVAIESENPQLSSLIAHKTPCVLVRWERLTAGACVPSRSESGSICYKLGIVVDTIHADPKLIGTSIILSSIDSGASADGKYSFDTPQDPNKPLRYRAENWSIIPADMLFHPHRGNDRLHIISHESADVIPGRQLAEIPILPLEWQRAKDTMLLKTTP